MRRLLTIAAFLLLIPLGVHAQTSSGTEQITSFVSAMTIHADGSVLVKETIQYDLGNYPKHGIFRTLPYQYTRDGASYNLRYHVESVTDEKGNAIPETTQTIGGYVKVQIGDANVTTTGVHTYVITYTVQRAILAINNREELYWNVTGNEWPVPIQQASTTITLPTGVNPLELKCYTGVVGSTSSACAISMPSTSTTIQALGNLATGEGLSVAIAVPTGTIALPSRATLARYFFQDNWYLAVPIVLWAFFHWRWYKRGRDPKGRGTIVPQYEAPDGMLPYTMGALEHTMVGGTELSATLIHLATCGYLTIADPGKGDYVFTLKKVTDASLAKPEQLLLDGMFGAGAAVGKAVKLADLKNVFYTHLAGIKSAMTDELTSRGYYAKNPMVVRGIAIALNVVCVGIFAVIIFAMQAVITVASVGSIVVAGILALVYAWLMPAKTPRGAEVHEEVQGFKWFLSVTETERLKFHNAPAKKPEQFEQFLA